MSLPVKGEVLPNLGKELHRASGRRRKRTEYSAAISEALKNNARSSSHATKTLMRWTGAGERTVKGWLAGTNGPSGEHLVELIRKSDEVWDSLRRLAERRSIEAPQLVALRSVLEAAVVSIDAILDQTDKQDSR
jgi:hypothetical protein